MLKPFLFILCLLCPFLTFGSTIPTYQIAAITTSNVETFNGAHFEIFPGDLLTIHGWQLGDDLRLELVTVTHFWNPVFFFHDAFHRGFVISIVNVTRGNQRVTAALSFPPEVPALGTYEIVSIDRNNGEITLSNATIWRFDLANVNSIPDWVPGQIVLIGQRNITPGAYFLNVDVENILAVDEL